MANPEFIYPDNTPGHFFVDQTCIACDTCVGIAPAHFALTDDCAHAFVTTQPSTDTDIARCEKALQQCPVQAIGYIQ